MGSVGDGIDSADAHDIQETAIGQTKRQELYALKIVDVPYQANASQPRVVNVPLIGKNTEEALNKLPPLEQATARIYYASDLDGSSDTTSVLERHLTRHYANLKARARLLHRYFFDADFCTKNDSRSLSFQWDRSAQDNLDLDEVSTISVSYSASRRLNSFLMCLSLDQDKTIAIHYGSSISKNDLRLSNRLSGSKALTTTDHKTSEQFVKALVLDFLSGSFYLSYEQDYRFANTLEGEIVLGTFNATFDLEDRLRKKHTELVAQHETVIEDMNDLSESIDFVAEAYLMDTSGSSSDVIGRNRVLALQHLCRKRLKCAIRSMEKLNRALESHDKILNIQESVSVKRLTVLATIFLPLSLSASILSMQERFADLHLKLYDFLGVFVIVGSAALLLMLIVRGWSKFKASIFDPFVALAETRKSTSHTDDKIFAVGLWTLYLIMWAVLLASFIVGMVKDAILGLKILGYGAAGVLGYAILSLVLLIWYAHWLDNHPEWEHRV